MLIFLNQILFEAIYKKFLYEEYNILHRRKNYSKLKKTKETILKI